MGFLVLRTCKAAHQTKHELSLPLHDVERHHFQASMIDDVEEDQGRMSPVIIALCSQPAEAYMACKTPLVH